MGYFSNGTEGLDYEARYCDRCVHQKPDKFCPVWEAHLCANYEECDKPDSILHILIPRTADGLENEQCRMFYERGRGPIEEDTPAETLREA